MVTRGQDRSLSVYRLEDFDDVAERLREARETTPRPELSSATSLPVPTNNVPMLKGGSRCPRGTGSTPDS